MTDFSTQLRFHSRFRERFQASKYTSLSLLSHDADLSRPMANKIFNGHFNASKSGPGIFNVKRLAHAMGTTVSYLTGEDIATDTNDQLVFSGNAATKNTIQRLMETHWRGAGRLEAFDSLLEDCDQYAVPDARDQTPTILRVGKRTLFSRRLGGPFLRDAQSELRAFSAEKKKDVLEFHRLTVKLRTHIGNSYLDHELKTRPARVSAPNIRLGLLVKDAKGKSTILIHAAAIPP